MRRGDRVGGRFEILGEAGRGGMGTVFRARDLRARRDVAVKVVADVSPAAAARFAREAELLAGVRHPGVVGYVAHGAERDGRGYLVMDWVDGATLAARLGDGALAVGEAVAIARATADALAALHAVGVVHRDVKPSNLMLGRGGGVTLVDLGVARRAGDRGRLTRTGAQVGTAGYMAPEQARGDHARLGPAADLFALGCVLFECVTGAAPFAADSELACRARLVLETAPRLAQLAPATPPALDALVAALLARAPEERPADAAAVAAALGALGDLPPGRLARAAGPGAATDDAPTRAAPRRCAVVITRAAASGADGRGDAVNRDGDAPVDAEARAEADARADADALAAIARAAAPTAETRVERFDGGAALIAVGPLADAAALAAAVAAARPGAIVGAAAGASIAEALARGVGAIEDAELVAARGGPGAAGLHVAADAAPVAADAATPRPAGSHA